MGLTIPDLLDGSTAGGQPESGWADTTDGEIVSALLAHPSGLRLETLAQVLGEPADAMADRLSRLNVRLRRIGLGLTSARTVVALISLPRASLSDERIRDVQKQIGGRAQVTKGEAKIVYAVLQGKATLKGLRASANGHLRTGKLVNAGVIQSGPREIDPAELTPDVRYSLLLDDEPEPADVGS